MGQRSGLMATLREAISGDKEAIKRLKSGRFWVFGFRDGQRVDLQNEEIGAAEARIASNEIVLGACERDDANGS